MSNCRHGVLVWDEHISGLYSSHPPRARGSSIVFHPWTSRIHFSYSTQPIAEFQGRRRWEEIGEINKISGGSMISSGRGSPTTDTAMFRKMCMPKRKNRDCLRTCPDAPLDPPLKINKWFSCYRRNSAKNEKWKAKSMVYSLAVALPNCRGKNSPKQCGCSLVYPVSCCQYSCVFATTTPHIRVFLWNSGWAGKFAQTEK